MRYSRIRDKKNKIPAEVYLEQNRKVRRMMMKKNIYSILKGTFLVSDDAFKNWRGIIYVSVLAIIMIASSHSADKKVYEIARLNNEVKEMRSAFVDGRSKLMRLKMESTVVVKMKEKGLAPSVIPPKKIKVKSQN
jgi:hypothetical protein